MHGENATLRLPNLSAEELVRVQAARAAGIKPGSDLEVLSVVGPVQNQVTLRRKEFRRLRQSTDGAGDELYLDDSCVDALGNCLNAASVSSATGGEDCSPCSQRGRQPGREVLVSHRSYQVQLRMEPGRWASAPATASDCQSASCWPPVGSFQVRSAGVNATCGWMRMMRGAQALHRLPHCGGVEGAS